ncbi:hypothetical protein B0H11DRAFT_2264515 [Mycena galericulata]|nr:hypothetical protein B0H11DRAFT_2264515 [Mycena galericulata]
MSVYNDCRTVILYQPPSALKYANDQPEERYSVLPAVLSWLSDMARQSIQPALLYQPMHGVLMVPDLNKGERYVPVCWSPDFLWNSAIAADNYRRNSFVFVSYDICCQWSENTHTPVGACDGEGVERPVSASDGEGVEHHDAGFAERAWAETRVEGAWPLKMMGPGQRWDRLE